MLGNYELAQSPQANLAIEDVLLLLVRLYKEYNTLKKQCKEKELYEQLAELVCTGSLSSLLSISTEVSKDNIAQAERALESEIRKKKDTVSKLEKKAGEGLWEATWMKEGKECEQFFEEKHVKRYIAESQPGVVVSNEQIAAMRMVLFRHMCEGIQKDKEQSLVCVKRFAAKYAGLVKKIAKDYPTYFVSQTIARACIADPSLANEVIEHLSTIKKG